MRLGGSTVVLAILLGVVPALAQESPGIIPAAKQSTETAKAVRKHSKPKIAAPKIAAPKVATARAPAPSAAARRAAAPKIAAPVTIDAKTAAIQVVSTRTESTTDASAGLSDSERLKIQSALLWSGDYTGSIGGEDSFLSAVKNFQKRAKTKVTGILTPTERTNLLAAAKNHEDEYGWTIVTDPSTGVRLGLPAKLVTQVREAARGTRYSSAHGDVQIETFRIKTTDLKPVALFDQEKKEPSTRKVESSVLRDDSFFITGMQGLKKFSVRAYARDGEIRGFTLLFDQMMETIVEPVMAAMVSAFAPFPEHSSPFAAMAKSVEYGNGLIVSDRGHIITDRKLAAGCQVIVAEGIGDADRVAEDKDGGLALLRVYGPHKVSPLVLSAATFKKGDVTLVGIPDPKEQNGARKLAEIKARLAENNAIELRQPVPMAGFSGAAAVDAQGQFLGMMQTQNFVLASTESVAPPVRLVTAAAIRDFLAAHDVAPATDGGDAKLAVVRIICVRN
jgi:hypothetical protein